MNPAMAPATAPRSRESQHRVLVHSQDDHEPRVIQGSELASELVAGDLLVVNDAATFPASLRARRKTGERVELRFFPNPSAGPGVTSEWEALVFGEGSWRDRTEDRPRVELELGEKLEVEPDLSLEILDFQHASPRWIILRFSRPDERVWSALYRLGRPVQYSYLQRAIEIWDVQNLYSARPWASELPSAGRILGDALWEKLIRRGVRVVALTHSTGLSSTGDAELDRHLPAPEYYEIPSRTAQAIEEARVCGRRVIAVGTSVVRALESQARLHPLSTLLPGSAWTGLIVGADHQRRVVDGILTGVHDVTESHFRMLECFVDREVLDRISDRASAAGLLSHEFGDSVLVLGSGKMTQVSTGSRRTPFR